MSEKIVQLKNKQKTASKVHRGKAQRVEAMKD